MNIKTVTTSDGVNTVDFGSAASRFYWFRNIGTTTVYVSGNSDISAGVDGVAELPSGGSVCIETLGGKVYILGEGKVQIHNTGDKFCPFRNAPVADGGVMASGNPVQIDGLQGGVPFSEIAVSGKNLLKYPYVQSTRTSYGITFTDNGNGTITASGTHDGGNDSAYFGFSPWWTDIKKYGRIFLPKGKTITFKIKGLPNTYKCEIFVMKDSTSAEAITTVSAAGETAAKYTAEQDCYIACGIYGSKSSVGQTVNFTAYPQLELGTEATEWEAPITGRELQVNVCGKNLIPYPYAQTTRTAEGITWTDNGDGSIIANGTATAQTWFTIFDNKKFNGGTYTLSGNQISGKLKYDSNFVWTDNNGNKHWVIDYGDGITFTLPYKVTASFLLRIYNGITVDNIVFSPQLEFGTEATDYESYHGASYTITPDSNPYVLSNDIRQQDGYNVVSVSEGELSVVGVRKNAALKKLWDEIDEIKTAIIVSNGESE